MGVGHESDIAVNNGTGCQSVGLLSGQIVENAGPDFYLSFLIHDSPLLGYFSIEHLTVVVEVELTPSGSEPDVLTPGHPTVTPSIENSPAE
jgi:hypothetical protein